MSHVLVADIGRTTCRVARFDRARRVAAARVASGASLADSEGATRVIAALRAGLDELPAGDPVDGCTRLGAMWRIVLPLAGPGIAACSIYVFIAAWNEFLFALTFTNSDSMRTLPVALQAFIGRNATDHGAIMAASTLFTLPVVVFFLFVHKRLRGHGQRRGEGLSASPAAPRTKGTPIAIGVSYFGNRILRHVRSDMEDLVTRGFTGVLHTFSENDYNWYRGQMGRIVEVSHDLGLEVQVGPWGLAHAFGGEAESLFMTQNPYLGQVFADGRQVGAGCPSQPEFRAFVKQWAQAAIEIGADRIFWDEPHWAHPVRFHPQPDATEAWTCVCAACSDAYRERFGHAMPHELTEEVTAFREQVLSDFVRELVACVDGLGGRSTVCLLPSVDGLHAVDSWEPIASAPGLDTLATDPYWSFFGLDVTEFVGGQARRTVELAREHDLTPQIWIQGFELGPDDETDIHAAVGAARDAGVEDLWTWGYEACGHMSHLQTREPERVWEILTEALTGGRS